MKFRSSAALLASMYIAFSATAAYAGNPSWWDASVKLTNSSSWDIHHLYLSPSDQTSWGPDQLRDDILETDDSYTLTGIDCDSYDFKVVDEDGDECIVEDIDLCVEDEEFDIDDETLLVCQWATAAESDEEEE